MSFFKLAPWFTLGLIIGMLILLEVGRRIGVKRLNEDTESGRTGLGAIEGAAFALLGLLIAFTFADAASRFNHRRDLILEEANAIGTAYLRIDCLPPSSQPKMRELFRQYLDARLRVYAVIPDVDQAYKELEQSVNLQADIWKTAVAAAQQPDAHPSAPMLALPAINSMIDVTTLRTMAPQTHPPMIIFGLLFVLALLCSLFAGHAMAAARRRSWLHVVGFAFVLVLTIYVILDMEYPRRGLIRVSNFDQVLIDLRHGMDK